MSSRICPNCGRVNRSGAKFCSQCGATLTSPVTLKPGTTLHNGRYVIDKQLGKGGMGATYLAKDTQAFDRPCVIKVMLPYFDLDDPNDFQLAIKRFEQEARALAELGTHPNIPNLLH
ncbi:MAG: inactive serine/threonine-protein kinase VRK3 [Armatimonadetes bacterium]|nr:inactive serine/threonine-protein kinase VRK3 [Armatimonadota bacterium]MDW8029444.1 inactive serine/threonine-protein kinase VRK3 [Armatimonadota bacterium]